MKRVAILMALYASAAVASPKATKIEPKPFADISKMAPRELVNYACQLASIKAIDLQRQHDEIQYATATGDRSELHDWDAELERIGRKIGEITIKLAGSPPYVTLDLSRCPQFAPPW